MTDTPTHEALRQCRDAITQLIACHDEPECPALETGRAALAAADAALSVPAGDAYGLALLAAWDKVRDPGPAGDDVPHPVFVEGFKAAWQARASIPAPAALSVQAEPVAQIKRLKDAIKGECDGLAITDDHARAILQYVLGDATPQPPAPVPAPSVGAEGLPPLPEPALCSDVVSSLLGPDLVEPLYTADQMRAYALAALASRPAVDADRRDAERYRFLRADFSPMGLNIDGNHAWAYRRNLTLKGPTLDAAIDAARHPAQREGE